MMNRTERRQQQKQQLKKIKRKRRLMISVLLLIIVGGAGLVLFLLRPAIQLVGKDEMRLSYNQEFHDPGVKLFSRKDALDPHAYSETGKVDSTKPGRYTLTYSYANHGIKSKVKRTVIVKKQQDFEPPKIKLKGDEMITLEQGKAYKEPGAKVTDKYDKNVQKKLKITGKVDINKPGAYKITYEDTDQSNNTTKIVREVVVANGIIYLTFDDGPSDEVTPLVLKTLADEHVKGTFFVTGYGSDKTLKQVHDAGQTIGLHTYSHDYAKVYQSTDAYYQDLKQISDRVKRVTGEESKLVRFPGGSSNTISANYTPGIMSALVDSVQQAGYQYFDWNISSGDGAEQDSPDIPYNNVTTTLMPGEENIVLMHDTKKNSADALKRIIDFGKEHGYGFKTLTVDGFTVHHGVNN